MAATMQQFIREASVLLKRLYVKHHASRATYKEGAELLAVQKMPRATEADRRQFVNFALTCFDLMARSGLDPDQSVLDLGKKMAERNRKRTIVPGVN